MGILGRLRGRRARWEESWRSFPGALGEVAAEWTVDLGAVEAAPVADLPVRLDVVHQLGPAGDASASDPAAVTRVEDAVRGVVQRLGGAYIGRVVSPGQARYTGHLPAEPATPVEIAGAGTGVTAYDPHWAYVRDSLAPDERQYQWLADMGEVAALTGRGDQLAVAREVSHLAYFADPEAAERAAVELRADGFATSLQRDTEDGFALVATRRDPVAAPGVHELSWRVHEMVERHGGGYAGWSCETAKAA
jgi:Regulator of ribonuclease activity B